MKAKHLEGCHYDQHDNGKNNLSHGLFSDVGSEP